eukprot:CAMPEP_0197690336 /NCGR_PEP_ID=MMETSP1338-20131121/108215_1 /TAXON_ID=43686 ORGANISM="Pelagodinium beii, Strain RCC1491" /NCGR_SAMPLE_ID=MMETSP1338 /ASSEMBLY_ACC=CAM_ASM_000754 /LENGTH=212 /DNA_ID=CAMNT_0043272779 /DNA_START=187 /DNA_END=823 /DNA_ORIENTATION=-
MAFACGSWRKPGGSTPEGCVAPGKGIMAGYGGLNPAPGGPAGNPPQGAPRGSGCVPGAPVYMAAWTIIAASICGSIDEAFALAAMVPSRSLVDKLAPVLVQLQQDLYLMTSRLSRTLRAAAAPKRRSASVQPLGRWWSHWGTSCQGNQPEASLTDHFTKRRPSPEDSFQLTPSFLHNVYTLNNVSLEKVCSGDILGLPDSSLEAATTFFKLP